MSTTFQVNGDNNVATLPASDLEAATFQVDGHGAAVGRFWLSFVPGASRSREQLVSSLFWISSFTQILGVTAVLYVPATGPVFDPYPAAYYITLAVILGAAAVELAAAYWLSCSNGRRALAFAKFVMHCAYPFFLIVFSMSGFAILFTKAFPVRG